MKTPFFLFKKKPPAKAIKHEDAPKTPQKGLKINENSLNITPKKKFLRPIVPYTPPQGVLPDGIRKTRLAIDKAAFDRVDFHHVMDTTNLSNYGYGGFPGYPYLAQLSQISEYRNATKIYAEEMTRKFIHLRYRDEGGDQKKIHELTQDIEQFGVRKIFRDAATHDGYFGVGYIYIDMLTPGGTLAWKDDDELRSTLILDKIKIPKGSLKGFKLVDPIWTYPGVYNATEPLAADWYRPEIWYVMGREVNQSRLISMKLNEVPDILKAAYNFGGISRSQLIETYVQNWLRTRDSVSDIVHSFILQGIKTDMSQVLFNFGEDGGENDQLGLRAKLYNRLRDNRGLMMLDKEKEEFFQFTTPLTTLDALQSQSLEQICAASLIPLVKYTGITPSGLNASSEGEIRVFYDTIHSFQESLFGDALRKIINIMQLNRYGEIDPDITFDFVPLYEMSESDKAKLDFEKARADTLYVSSGILSPAQVRNKVINESESEYTESPKSYRDILRQRDNNAAGTSQSRRIPGVSAPTGISDR